MFGSNIFSVANAYEVLTAIHKYFTLAVTSVLLTFMTTSVFPAKWTYFFSLSMPLTFEIMHTCISIQNTNVNEVLIDNHKFLPLLAISVPSHL